ncbi:hypothetical protein JTE90_027635 [Oedothorax gibbosus]|uniref:Uncharacterized protein n=1 Tax=Oedothorax gibbosus TaxID=931172 RepID=A0AAV6VJE2_9ARAC|nr:hypothetical protein JTE90_027635 [Oedothorax gibbosus]
MWNHHGNYGARTTNHLEGWHHALNKAVGKSHVDIFQFIKEIQKQHAKRQKQMIILDDGKKPPKIKPVYKRNNDKIINLTEEYVNRSITLAEFMSRIRHCFKK